jgi:hypothetical protein
LLQANVFIFFPLLSLRPFNFYALRGSELRLLIVLFAPAFEGLAHPYKENIVKLGDNHVIGNLPEVREALQEARS